MVINYLSVIIEKDTTNFISFTNENETYELNYFFSLISEKDLYNEIIDYFSLSYEKL